MTLATRTVTLPGGLQATLVHQPQADRAAALARVAAGSHHEPSRFPGLAHLLEHLLFYGGERYQDDDRLMGWVQRQGSRAIRLRLMDQGGLQAARQSDGAGR